MTTPAVAVRLLQIEAALRPLADSLQAVPMRAYMLDQFAFLGIRATPRREALRGLPRLNIWTASGQRLRSRHLNRPGTRPVLRNRPGWHMNVDICFLKQGGVELHHVSA